METGDARVGRLSLVDTGWKLMDREAGQECADPSDGHWTEGGGGGAGSEVSYITIRDGD